VKTWSDYHFVGDKFPQYYYIGTGNPVRTMHKYVQGNEVIVNSLTEYMKMIRRIHPYSTFKVEKFGSVGWQIKELVE
jgi:flavin reductase (DIM6/NTAB) family NADH-FMN oxidoreductase RutF